MTLLLLGGTADARRIAQELHARGVDLVYSIAGLVRQPQLDCRVISGGFSARGGLARFVADEGIGAILDATHPYAERMSATALGVARSQGLPIWRYQRPAWQAQAGDDWREFEDWPALLPRLRSLRSVFFSAGQLTAEFVEQLAAQNPGGEQRQVLRSANRSDFPLPDTMTWIEAIGPFDRDGERALFERFSFDALVSKNSGGPATAAKLDVARERGVPVFMLRRPDLPAADAEFADAGDCSGFVSSQLAEKA